MDPLGLAQLKAVVVAEHVNVSKVAILGAGGSLGRHVLREAIDATYNVTAVVRTPSKLPVEVRAKATVRQSDLNTSSVKELAAILSGHDAVINTAGFVTEGQVFVDLIDRVVTSLESLPATERPACWFMAGAALLDIDESGRRGVDLPRIRSTYWPHRANFERLRSTSLDWRLLCPGPMVDQQPLGIGKLRVSLERLPVRVSSFARALPGLLFLPVFAYLVPQMIVSYADAASLMLANLSRPNEMSRHRVGLALPMGLRGKKNERAAQARNPA